VSLDRRFLVCGLAYAIFGMCVGIYMAASKDHSEFVAHAHILLVGFVVSFITAMIVVKTFLNYVTRHGFTFFAWWRVIVGTLGLIALALGR